MAVQICNKKGEDNVNGKDAVDNVVNDEKCVLLVRKKCKLEGAYPSRINHQNNQQHLPSPVSREN